MHSNLGIKNKIKLRKGEKKQTNPQNPNCDILQYFQIKLKLKNPSKGSNDIIIDFLKFTLIDN